MLRILGRSTVISQRSRNPAVLRLYSKGAQPQSTSSSVNVTGLSNNCVKIPNQPVGPGAAKEKEYKNPEYFCYHVDSFAEAEVELAKFRLPAPSNKKKCIK